MLSGVIKESEKVHERIVKVTPNEHFYEEKGVGIYKKYSCPVCQAVGNRNVGVYDGQENCSLCGVNLNWARKPEVGDYVILTHNLNSDFLQGDQCTIKEDNTADPSALPYIVTKESKQIGCKLRDFSILELESY